ncbi:MAG: putative anion-transporting ATPase [Candidatus Scalindua rubra]|uniref:arsenite-transporting ATPase n=1 Tax=Candidatus Scalindua rubra TaxID=1872076 RepID=A0A1E3XEB7_9BACT|nr:MAG: putative anion-transporting ATPase [Candidatus Scalindua rubra]
MRIILFTGKGGVGKTSISAATAVKCAELGYKTLVTSTDPAHSLSDSFDMEIGYEIKELGNNLYGLEIDVQEELMKNWGTIQNFIKQNLVKAGGFSDIIAEELAIFPGMEELFSLLKIKTYYDQDEFDVALIDCAPTGGTVRMLSFPDILQWYMEKIFHVEKKLMKMVKPFVNPLVKIELPGDDVYGNIEDMYKKLDGLNEVLSDEKKTSVRLVMNPEKMVIKESQRAYAYLNLFNFPVDAVIVNKIFPKSAEGEYLSKWYHIQQKHLQEIKCAFSPLKILKVGFKNTEVVGFDLLRKMANELYNENDPTKIFYDKKPIEIYQRDGMNRISIHMPFTKKEDIDMWVKGGELIVKIENFKRNIILPRAFKSLDITDAKFEGERLNVTFGGNRNDSKEN